MGKFGHQRGSQILGEAHVSLIQRAASNLKSKEAPKTFTKSGIGTPKEVKSENLEDLLVTSDSDNGVAEIKPWEEPAPEKPQTDQKTSYVRLPGAVLKNEEDEEMVVEKEVRAKELVNYLLDKWDVQIDKKSSLVEVDYRVKDMLLHRPPANHWLLKRARQKIAEHTGFFSNVTKPYEFLGVPEMDNDMVLFRNLPEFLKVTPHEWMEVQMRREREKEKAKARLPHVKHMKGKRSIYLRGRLKRGAGGIVQAEKLIANGDRFQREIRGNLTFTNLLEKWAETKDEESANRGSPFGQVKRTKTKKEVVAMPDLTGAGGVGYERDDLGRVVTQVDEKVYQQFLTMEKMITAIYVLIKSMLNVKPGQLKSSNRIPFSGVMELRSRKGTATSPRMKTPPVALLNKFCKNTGFYSAVSRGLIGKSTVSDVNNDKQDEHLSEMQLSDNIKTAEFEKRLKNMGPRNSKIQYQGSGRQVPDPFNSVTVEEVYPLSETGSAEDIKSAVDRVKLITESEYYLDDRPFELRSTNLRKERPMTQAERLRRHSERFRNMFLHRFKSPESIWWNVYVRDYKRLEDELAEKEEEYVNPTRSSHELTIKSNTSVIMFRSEKNPDPDEIPTPKLPGPPSIEQLNSEEQSRLNLLMIVPEAAYGLPTRSAMRNLYECAGVKTLDKDLFDIMMSIKRPFRVLEKSLRSALTNKLEKYEWDTMKRYRAKIQADCTSPIHERAIGNMRYLAKLAAKKEQELIENNVEDTDLSEKQPALWFRELIEMCDKIGALRHHGCSSIVHELVRYCDVHSNFKPFMIKRFCLLVISLPANELASPHYQKAISFLLDRLFGAPTELLHEWLVYRGFKPLI